MTQSPTTPSGPAPERSPAPEHSLERSEHESVAVYVRRGRTPTLAFWVVLALLISFFAGALGAVLLGALDLPAVFSAALLAVVVIGLPIAAVIAGVDALRQRGRRSR